MLDINSTEDCIFNLEWIIKESLWNTEYVGIRQNGKRFNYAYFLKVDCFSNLFITVQCYFFKETV